MRLEGPRVDRKMGQCYRAFEGLFLRLRDIRHKGLGDQAKCPHTNIEPTWDEDVIAGATRLLIAKDPRPSVRSGAEGPPHGPLDRNCFKAKVYTYEYGNTPKP